VSSTNGFKGWYLGGPYPAALPEEVRGYFAEMGRIAVELGNSARDVVLSGDPEKAAEIDREDDAMDDLHRHLFSVLMNREWKHAVASAVDVTLLGRLYERFADHAVEIGRRVVFQVTGRVANGEVVQRKCADVDGRRDGCQAEFLFTIVLLVHHRFPFG
jgi:phosphate uptake regulator